MIVDRSLWSKKKEFMLRRLLEDRDIGYLDEELYDILIEFFRREGTFTISSCSGRVVFIDTQMPWVRKGSTIIFKKHKPVTVEECLDIINKPILHNLWMIVTGPIIHASTASLREARLITSIARTAGFKHSGIISIRRDGIIIELKSGVGVTQIIKSGNTILVNIDRISELVEICNKVLLKGKERLYRLKELLIKYREVT
jgi:tRNA wybutosine-synthesizing protein 3